MGGRGASYYYDRFTQNEIYTGDPVDPKEFLNDPETIIHTDMFKKLKSNGISTRKSTDDIPLENLKPQQKQANEIAKHYKNLLYETTDYQDIQLGSKYIRGSVNGYMSPLYENGNLKIRVTLDKQLIKNDAELKSMIKHAVSNKHFTNINVDSNYKEYIITHEMGHVVEECLIQRLRNKDPVSYANKGTKEIAIKIRKDIETICKNKYNGDKIKISNYATTNSMEWFAETFTNLWLADNPEKTALAMSDYLEEYLK